MMIDINANVVGKQYFQSRQGSSQWGTSRKVREVKEISDLGQRPSLEDLFLSFVRFLASRKVSSQEQAAVYESIVMCLFCGKLLRYKSVILIADKLIILLKIRVAVTVFR